MEKVHINLSDWQKRVWKDQRRFVVVNCGRRAGKTYLISYYMFYLATQKAGINIWYVAPTYKQAKNILWEMLVMMIPTSAVKKRNETELKVTLTNGSTIWVKGSEDPDSLRGVKIDFAVFDECAFIDKWDIVWKVMRPTLIDSRASCWFVSTPNGFNHFKDLSEINSPDYSYHHYTSYENPFIDKAEIDATKAEYLSQGQEDAYYQEIMGEFRKMSGLVYKNFNREVHMVPIPDYTLDTNWTYTRALDFGFAHKSALGYFAISPDQKTIYLYDGVYVSGLNEKQISDIVKVKDKGKHMTYPVADSAQPMSISELATNGVTFQPVEKGKDSVKQGIVKVSKLLAVRNDTGKPTLMINKYLTWVADEFERYRWIEQKDDSSLFREIPYKANDDAMDMISYFARSWKEQERVYKSYDRNKWGIG